MAKAKITITGSGKSDAYTPYAFLYINNTVYTSAQVVEVELGTVCQCRVGRGTTGVVAILLDGNPVKEVTDTYGEAIYELTVNRNYTIELGVATGATINITTGAEVASDDIHNSLIGGTAREIESGTVLIGGVLREIESGLVLVNGVAREIAFGSAKAKVSQLSVGDIVFAPVNGVQKEFIVVQQGAPSSLYDSSCDGTWLLMKDCVAQVQWDASGTGTNYSKSNAHTYVSGTFLGMLSTGLKNKIKTVKIPYQGNGVQSGANGLSTQAFLLSARELGFNGGTYMPKDGETLSYFNGASAADKIAYLNGTAVKWHTRTPWIRYSNPYAYFITTTGAYDYDASLSAGIRPAFILDPETQYDPNTMEILY